MNLKVRKELHSGLQMLWLLGYIMQVEEEREQARAGCQLTYAAENRMSVAQLDRPS